jgi:hypothetical protein
MKKRLLWLRLLMTTLLASSALVALAGTAAEAGTGVFPCSTFKPTAYQWKRSCKGTTSRYGSEATGVATRLYQSRTVPGLGGLAAFAITISDTVADGDCAYLKLEQEAQSTFWFGTCGSGTSRRIDWDDSQHYPGTFVRVSICTTKAACSVVWYQDLTDPGPTG